MEQVLTCIKQLLAAWNLPGSTTTDGQDLINGTLMTTAPLINPLLAVWSEDLDPAAKLTLGAFLAKLPSRNLISYKELEALAQDLQAATLVVV